MTSPGADNELIADYVAKGSDTAFRTLVNRHVNLVYATALRQTGNAGAAEEITQSVFLVLAQKAPRLAGMETLAGWLHRSAILESKARVRADLRRVRREEAAAEIASLQREGTSPSEALIPLVDEALLQLRESDRLALMLRFWEERNLREVGAVLGIEEDAARKRVARALDRLSEFFRKRGFAGAGSAGCAALMTETATGIAPAALAVSATNAGLAAGSTGGIHLAWFKLMAITKTQTAVVCTLLAAIPLGLQWQANARVARQEADAPAQLVLTRENAEQLEAQLERIRTELVQARRNALDAETRLAITTVQPGTVRKAYRWDDNSPLVRVPKQVLREFDITATVNQNGTLSRAIKEALQMTEAEAQQTQAIVDKFLATYNSARTQTMRPVEATERELRGRDSETVRVLEAPEIPFYEMRQTFFAELEDTLGLERAEGFRFALQHWMPVKEMNGVNTGWAVLDFGYRIRFQQPDPGDRRLGWSINVMAPKNGSMSASFPLSEIPDLYRPHLQDWIALAQSQPPKDKTSTP